MEKTNLVEACEKAAEMMVEVLNNEQNPVVVRVEAAKALAMLTEVGVRVRTNAGTFELFERLNKGEDIFKSFGDLFKGFKF